eukprot:jgi/Chlat1/6074/Chrsp4S06222
MPVTLAIAGDVAAEKAAAEETSPPLHPCWSSLSKLCCVLLLFSVWWAFVVFVVAWLLQWKGGIAYGRCNILSVDNNNNTTNHNNVLTSLATSLADFGPPVPRDGGVKGVLRQLAPDREGCRLAFADKDDGDKVWIALIERSTCSFHDKVLHAQLAGAVAAIVYNNEVDQDLFTMVAQTASQDIRIPSVFINKQDGYLLLVSLLMRQQEHEERVTVLLEPSKEGNNNGSEPIGGDEEAVIDVNCKAVPPPSLVAIVSDGNSKVEEGERKVEEQETQHLMCDYKHQEKVGMPPIYYP